MLYCLYAEVDRLSFVQEQITQSSLQCEGQERNRVARAQKLWESKAAAESGDHAFACEKLMQVSIYPAIHLGMSHWLKQAFM